MEKFSPCKYINKVNFWFLSFAIKAENDINELYLGYSSPNSFFEIRVSFGDSLFTLI